MTRRLLAFSRQQTLAPEPVNVNDLLSGMSDMLRRTITESIKIETVLAKGAWPICVDPHELEATVLNLAVNARDAMPDGGNLTIETSNTVLDAAQARQAELTAGEYVMIAVTDTGMGMAPEVAQRAFEPFFTTKGIGKGTGLGLSQVYGFIKQSGGHVSIDTELGRGVCIKLYLPRSEKGASTDESRSRVTPAADAVRNRPPILVVEDDPEVLKVTAGMLTELGYRTIEADCAATALALLERHPDVELLFTDIGMSDMSGRQLAEIALRDRPRLKVLYTTGYNRNAVVNGGVLSENAELIMKPFSLETLSDKVDQILR